MKGAKWKLQEDLSSLSNNDYKGERVLDNCLIIRDQKVICDPI